MGTYPYQNTGNCASTHFSLVPDAQKMPLRRILDKTQNNGGKCAATGRLLLRSVYGGSKDSDTVHGGE